MVGPKAYLCACILKDAANAALTHSLLNFRGTSPGPWGRGHGILGDGSGRGHDSRVLEVVCFVAFSLRLVELVGSTVVRIESRDFLPRRSAGP